MKMRSLLLFISSILVSLALISCNGTFEVSLDQTPTPGLPTAVPEQTAAGLSSNGTDVSFMGTSFSIPFELANGTENIIVPREGSTDPAVASLLVWPAHPRMTLQGYPLQDTLYKPQIEVFPADEYQKMSSDPATSQADAQTAIATLQYILSTGRFVYQDPFPFLPDQHANQLLMSQETILSFKNGNGIRYITSYSQAAFPDFGSNLIYTFQGITLDGKYYVSVIMPVHLDGLDTAPQNGDQYPGYLNATFERLQQADSVFDPSLETLDAMIESLMVEGFTITDESMPTAEPVATTDKEGEWITNVGKLTITQNGPEIIAALDGYGDLERKDSLQGTWVGDTVKLNSQLLGDLTMIFSGDTFTTVDNSRVSFCGVRAKVSSDLPVGCGFSGIWHFAPSNFFPEGSSVTMKQTVDQVSGELYDGKGNIFNTITGQIFWGKGWGLTGTDKEGHSISLIMTSFETAFEYVYEDLYQLQLCAVRDGVTRVDLGNFICSIQ